MRCVKCGQEIQSGSICANCGAMVEVPEKTVIQPIETNGIVNLSEDNNNVVMEENNLGQIAEDTIQPEMIKKSNKTFYLIFTLVSALVLVVFIYIMLQYFNPKIAVKGLNNEYNYSDFIKKTWSVNGSMFINASNTEWLINGHVFAKGKTVDYIPVVIGENTLTIKNNNAEAVYYLNIVNDSSLLTEGNYAITQDYLDFDGDGISNIVEESNGTSPNSNDTDNDGLFDNVEMILGLNPNKKDNYDEVREYKVIQDNNKSSKNYAIVKAKGNVANTFLDTYTLSVGFSSTFIQSDTLRLTTTNKEKPESMIIYFSKETSWDLEQYSIYMFNERTGELKELTTKMSDKYLIANIADFDNIYFVGRKSNVPKEYLNQIIILIDNSGSMFDMNYVTSNPNANPSAYYHDADFKRLELMNGLVDQLGTENYEYSVYAFTATYCNMIKYSQNATAIKKQINALKNECQKFNGTDMSGAIKEYANTFKDDVYGAKYMIVLTDGVDTGNNIFNLSEYYLNNYRKQGIHIITIGLSSDVNSDYLMDIAYLTKGKYLFASDANMLNSLSTIIESSINKSTDSIKINNKDYILVADSGFQVTRDGFSFGNFATTESPKSNSFGFSYLAKKLYLNQLYDENGKSDIVKSDLTPKNSERLIKGNIYNVNLSDKYNELLNNNSPLDLTDITNEDDDYQLLQIISEAFSVQNKVFLTKINDYILKHFQSQFFDYDNDLNQMIDELQSGSPAILALSSSAGTHSVLATKIYKSVGSDEYVITVYDSEIPGQEGKIYLTRNTAYYEYAKSSYYTLSYNEYNIEFNNMLYVNQYN